MENKKLNDRLRIGDLLVAKQIITSEQLEYALEEQKKQNARLGKTLISLGYIDEDTLLSIISEQLKIPFVDLHNFNYKRADVTSLKETISRRYRAVVLKQEENKVILGMCDPEDLFCMDEVSRIFNKKIEPVIVPEDDLMEVLDSSYSQSGNIASIAEELSVELDDAVIKVDNLVDEVSNEDAPVVRLIQKIFEEAVSFNASDIHIEPDEKVLRVRMRVDGVLTEQVMHEKKISSALAVRFKLISGLDISEKRLPQDGRFNINVKNKNIDVRISTMPIQFGESIVMRLMLVDNGVRSIDEIGIDEKIKNHLLTFLRQPYGLMLVTGPTGSGKTTTLYAALSELNSPENKIITVEDPVEYRLPRLNQVQIKEKIGLNFHNVLRSALRQDPDVLLIGEIRDSDSAEIALRSAMTGHLVLSTLHTNDAISSALRLIDMGVDPFLVAASLKVIIAQRLIRCLCEKCKTVDTNIVDHAHLLCDDQQEHTYFKPVGCVHCFNTGYSGRTGIFEYLHINHALADALRERDIAEFSRLARQSTSFNSLRESALELAQQGLTSLSEVERLSLNSEID